jgi:crotonobetainyl-CoA:carnitine CoA-transferase CaiB-like acyl-CoA transferase
MRQRPLSGIRVLDLTNVLAGPFCSYQLMLLGAEVVKVEVPDRGDLARHLGPARSLNDAGMGASFLAQNAGKKSVELDLRDEVDRASFSSLLRGADVLLENFRAGTLARLGFDPERLRELNPGLVYCAISGFGQSGPMSQAPAYDQIIQGLSGMMSTTGTPETAPLRVGFPVCDTVGGLAAALAITAPAKAPISTCRCWRPRSPPWAGRCPTTS